jgi:tape measure domain-containing protein
MASMNEVIVSTDIYSSSLDRLLELTDRVTKRMLFVSLGAGLAAKSMREASIIAGQVADKMLISSSGLKDMVSKMDKAALTTDIVTDKLEAAGAKTKEVDNKAQDAAGAIEKTADKLGKAGENSKKSIHIMEKAGKVLKNIVGQVGKVNSGVRDKIGEKFDSVFKLDNLKKGMELIDNISRTNTKLGAVNDGNQTQGQLQNKIYAAAGNSRGSYSSMAGTVTKLEATTGNVFKTNDETIAFTELAQKSFVAGGGSKEERSSAMGQLTDSMAGGSLSGDDLSSLAQTAPAIVAAISSYTGKTGDELEALADKGQITSQDIKNAMFAASTEINDSFSQTPMTFDDIWTRIQEGGLQAFSGIMEQITELLETPEINGFINGLITGFGFLAEGASWIIDTITNGWSTIGPILGVAAIAALVLITMNVMAMAVSWLIAALPIILIIGLIGAVIAAALSMGVTWQEIIGFIGGAIGGFATAFYNGFVLIWNFIADFANFFGNVFNDPISSIKILFASMGIDLLSFIGSLVKGIVDLINMIPGVEINVNDGITNGISYLEGEVKKLKTESDFKEFVQHKETGELKDGALAGYDKGIDIANKIGNSVKSPLEGVIGDDPTKQLPFDPYKQAAATSESNPLPVKGTGPNDSVNVEMPEDDLDYLREIAERDYIANVATNSLAPNISVQFGDVHENADANKIAGRIREILQNEIAVASEGVY